MHLLLDHIVPLSSAVLTDRSMYRGREFHRHSPADLEALSIKHISCRYVCHDRLVLLIPGSHLYHIALVIVQRQRIPV
jgi:hypothetical protein